MSKRSGSTGIFWCVIAVCALVWPVFAQNEDCYEVGDPPTCVETDVVKVSDNRIYLDGWGISAVVVQQSGGVWATTGFLFLNPAAAENNISAVWYSRPALPGGTWASKAWVGGVWGAIKAVKEANVISDCQDGKWVTSAPQPAALVSNEGGDYASGLMLEDPLQDLIQAMSARDDLIQVLAENGYPAADIQIEETNGGMTVPVKDAWLDALAAGVDAQQQFNVDDSGNEAISAYVMATSWPCYPLSWTVPKAWGAWTPGSRSTRAVQIQGVWYCQDCRQACRSRTVVEYTLTLSCSVGVSNTRVETECYEQCGAVYPTSGGQCMGGPPMPPVPGAPPPGTRICRSTQ